VNSASCQCSLHASPAACWLRARAHHRYTTRLCTREAQASRRKGVTAASPGARARSRPPAAPRDAAGSRTLAKRHAPCRAQIAFCGIAYPSLVITYFGQAAFLMANPDQVGSTFSRPSPSATAFTGPSLSLPPPPRASPARRAADTPRPRARAGWCVGSRPRRMHAAQRSAGSTPASNAPARASRTQPCPVQLHSAGCSCLRPAAVARIIQHARAPRLRASRVPASTRAPPRARPWPPGARGRPPLPAGHDHGDVLHRAPVHLARLLPARHRQAHVGGRRGCACRAAPLPGRRPAP